MMAVFRKNRASVLGALLALSGTFASTGTALAALPAGAKAPDFTLQAALGGQPMSFSLRRALGSGPVVLYFFPAAFTKGCTVEAHDFAEATDRFKALHATVIGVTAGNIERVAEFSKLECRDKFAVAADAGAKVAALYDTRMQIGDRTLSNRTSFVIAPDGRILLSYTDQNPDAHIQKAMEAVTRFESQKN